MKDDALVIIQNDPNVSCGAYGDYLKEWGVPFRIVSLFAGESLPLPEKCGAIIVLGGAMGVYDTERHPMLHSLKSWISATVAQEVPILGICLGGQLLADVLGAPVLCPSPHGEKGTFTVTLTPEGEQDPLFTGFGSEFTTFQWHNDAFEIPQGAVRLAFSALCPNQAFRFGPAAWGTQFHPEMTQEMVAVWAGWRKETACRKEQLVAEFQSAGSSYRTSARQLLSNFLRAARLL